jgi:hypothetical protein
MNMHNVQISEMDLINFKKRKYVRQLTAVAIKKGELVRPQICDLCDETHHDIDAHHIDYGRPFDVVWLCPGCHGLAHSADHALNPANNSQSPLPLVCEKYNNVTVSFSMPIRNFLALKNESIAQKKSISELMRAESIKKFPILEEQLEFNFITGEKNGGSRKTEREIPVDIERISLLDADEIEMYKQKSPGLQKIRRSRGHDMRKLACI